MRRFALSAAIGVGAGVAAAIVLAVLELYVTGHGYGSITREILLLVVVLAAGLTWFSLQR